MKKFNKRSDQIKKNKFKLEINLLILPLKNSKLGENDTKLLKNNKERTVYYKIICFSSGGLQVTKRTI